MRMKVVGLVVAVVVGAFALLVAASVSYVDVYGDAIEIERAADEAAEQVEVYRESMLEMSDVASDIGSEGKKLMAATESYAREADVWAAAGDREREEDATARATEAGAATLSLMERSIDLMRDAVDGLEEMAVAAREAARLYEQAADAWAAAGDDGRARQVSDKAVSMSRYADDMNLKVAEGALVISKLVVALDESRVALDEGLAVRSGGFGWDIVSAPGK